MRVISKKTLDEYGDKHADARTPLAAWLKVMESKDYKNFSDLTQSINSVDVAGPNSIYHIFNIGGNNYRLIVGIHYEEYGRVYLRDFVKHEVYDSEPYKNKIRNGEL